MCSRKGLIKSLGLNYARDLNKSQVFRGCRGDGEEGGCMRPGMFKRLGKTCC